MASETTASGKSGVSPATTAAMTSTTPLRGNL
jgi:hypothetical protein